MSCPYAAMPQLAPACSWAGELAAYLAVQKTTLGIRAYQQLRSRQSTSTHGTCMHARVCTCTSRPLHAVRLAGPCRRPAVYRGKYREVLVAVKILLRQGVDPEDAEAVQQALTLSDPALADLQKEAELVRSALPRPAPVCVPPMFCRARLPVTAMLPARLGCPLGARACHGRLGGLPVGATQQGWLLLCLLFLLDQPPSACSPPAAGDSPPPKREQGLLQDRAEKLGSRNS